MCVHYKIPLNDLTDRRWKWLLPPSLSKSQQFLAGLSNKTRYITQYAVKTSRSALTLRIKQELFIKQRSYSTKLIDTTAPYQKEIFRASRILMRGWHTRRCISIDVHTWWWESTRGHKIMMSERVFQGWSFFCSLQDWLDFMSCVNVMTMKSFDDVLKKIDDGRFFLVGWIEV